jgi:hypothetical protein
MASYSAFTSATPPEALRQAIEFFGLTGSGLQMTNRDMTSVRLDGGGGHVQVSAQRAPDGRTELLIETMQFDDDVRRFVARLPQASFVGALLRRLRLRRRD